MPAAERRDQLLDAARALALESGFHAVTMAAVAEAAGVTRPLVYAQFGDLAGLTRALVERESRRALAGLTEALGSVDPHRSAADHAVAATRAVLAAVRSAPETWRVLLDPPQGGPPALYEAIDAGRALAREDVERTLDRAVQGAVVDPELTTELIHLTGHELVRLHLTNPEEYPEERILAQIATVVTGWLQDPLAAP